MTNPLYPTQGTNNWRLNSGAAPPNMLPPDQGNKTAFGQPGVDYPQAAVEMPKPLAAHEPATFRPATNPLASPKAVVPAGKLDVNGNPTTGAVNGMSVEGGAKATIDNATGQINRNSLWRGMPTNGGVGGALNVMSPEQNAAVSNIPSAGGGTPGASGTGEVWGGQQAQNFRDQLTNMIHQSLDKAGQRYTSPTGVSYGGSPHYIQMAEQLSNILGGGFTAQGQERAAMGELGVKQALLPSEIEKNKASAGYFGNRGASMMESAAARQQLADQQLQIAGMKSGAGKYGETNVAAEELRSKGLSPTPENVEAFNKGYKIVPAQKENKGSLWRGYSNSAPAIGAHMVPKDWAPTGKLLNGKPVYKDTQGNMQTPDNY